MDELKFTFYGVRGSYPVSNRKFIKFGGNTTSLLFETGSEIFVIDAGTGIVNAGEYIQKKENIKTINIFLTHLHVDHIMGLPFFNPLYDKEMRINLYCFKYPGFKYEDKIYSLFNQPLSPISQKGILADLRFYTFGESVNTPVIINDNTRVNCLKDDLHPKSGVLIYRVDFYDKKIVFATDIESKKGFKGEYSDFIKNADILIHDSQYTDSDYRSKSNSKAGYGHSTVDMAVSNAIKMNVEKLFLFHYSPEYSDKKLENMLKHARKKFKNTYLSKESKLNKLRR
ncbi:MAG: MBL fold metallo-hydrolase [Candidatus Aminicenantes bacterium]|nr:MBL fold metallo-hydrolase [Candidatus Aminicenantes bacterium]